MNFIGAPGQPPRLVTYANPPPAGMVGAGEVVIGAAQIADYVISADGKTLTPAAPTLDQQKAATLAALDVIAQAKLSFWTGGLAPAGGLQVDDISTGRITSWATQALVCKATGAAWGLPYWIMTDNSHRTFTGPDDFLTFAQAAETYKTAAVLQNSTLKGEINAAPDEAALAAIDLSAGWPS